MTAQGVHYRYGINRQDMDINAIDALKQYLDDHDPVSVDLRGTIVPI